MLSTYKTNKKTTDIIAEPGLQTGEDFTDHFTFDDKSYEIALYFSNLRFFR